jgi:hypothetical protein
MSGYIMTLRFKVRFASPKTQKRKEKTEKKEKRKQITSPGCGWQYK